MFSYNQILWVSYNERLLPFSEVSAKLRMNESTESVWGHNVHVCLFWNLLCGCNLRWKIRFIFKLPKLVDWFLSSELLVIDITREPYFLNPQLIQDSYELFGLNYFCLLSAYCFKKTSSVSQNRLQSCKNII